jgi:hypothetical protein
VFGWRFHSFKKSAAPWIGLPLFIGISAADCVWLEIHPYFEALDEFIYDGGCC